VNVVFHWRDGGAEPFIWSTNNRGMWCAVWRHDAQYAGWASWRSPIGARKETKLQASEAAAVAWCEAKMAAHDG